MDAVNYLHNELNIVHRDIKPQNIMINEDGTPILADFGKAYQLKSDEEDQSNAIEGT